MASRTRSIVKRRDPNAATECSHDGCDRPWIARGYCRRHYNEWYRTDPDRPRCAKCEKPATRRGLCGSHYEAAYLERKPRSRPKTPAKPTGPPSYKAAHKRLARRRGPARNHPCAQGCGRAAVHWAYDYSDFEPMQCPETGSLYSIDVSRYVPMCGFCHKRLDGGREYNVGSNNDGAWRIFKIPGWQ